MRVVKRIEMLIQRNNDDDNETLILFALFYAINYDIFAGFGIFSLPSAKNPNKQTKQKIPKCIS